MAWKLNTGLVGAKNEDPALKTKQREIQQLIRTFENRVQVPFGSAVFPELAERLDSLLKVVPTLSKKEVIITALDHILELCETAPERAIENLKIGAFESRGKVNLTTKIPVEMDERLTRLIKRFPEISRRQIAEAGLDLLLSKCETANGGPFLQAETQIAPRVTVQ
jgi:hypothetical protein